MSSSYSNLHAQHKRVYLDKFSTLPHLPSYPGAGPGFNKRIEYISPNLDHTGIRTAFQEKIQRPVKPNGRLTYDYKLNANVRVAKPANTLIKLDKKKIRSHFEKNSTYEERLFHIEQRRMELGSMCEKQLEAEKGFLVPAEPSTVEESGGVGYTQKKKMRPKKIFNQRTIVDCLLETSDMSICSSIRLPVDDQFGYPLDVDGGGTLETVSAMPSMVSQKSSNMSRRPINSEHWDTSALRKVYGSTLDDDE